MKTPFTKEEQEVMDSLIEAHNKFVELERMHPSEMREWILSFHRLQELLSMRVLQRDYADYFFKSSES